MISCPQFEARRAARTTRVTGVTTKTFEIQVHDDHLAKLAQARKPILAVAELIWNAVDADADEVIVTLHENDLGGLGRIDARDNGHGMPYAEAGRLFSGLGGSWKQFGSRRSKEKNRILHGKEGRGRLRAFALGRVVDWDVCYGAPAGRDLKTYRISMAADRLKKVDVYDESEAPSGRKRGVTVRISELAGSFPSLRAEGVTEELVQIFALYLRQYPDVAIVFDGRRIDPAAAVDVAEKYSLPSIVTDQGEAFDVELEVVEWKMPTERRLFFCNADGIPLDDIVAGIHAPGFDFTAYLKSEYFSKLVAENRLEIATLDAPTSRTLDAAKIALRDHFRKRSSERAAGLVERWQEEKVYPFEGDAASEVEEAERQVFNVVALNVNHFLPDFQDASERTKRFQFRLLRQAIESGPSDLFRILTDVLELPQEKRQELVQLLDRTTLSNIIGASKVISDRLEFLNGLETLVFDSEFKDAVRERAQLLRIVAENAWMFGEQYHLSVDDESLTQVLKKHLELAGREVEVDHEVRRPDGKRGIVDLMFSKNIQLAGSAEREHLVVELKRPNVKIDSEATTQLEGYAIAVAGDERFRGIPAKWVFWAVSSNVDAIVARRISQRDRAKGILFQDDQQPITIWVKTWSEVINDCKARLKFFADKLHYTPDRDSSLAHLRTTYYKYLADLFAIEDDSPSVGSPPKSPEVT
jgi:hypothetical protein